MSNANYKSTPKGNQNHIKMSGDVVMIPDDAHIKAKYSVTLEYNEINCLGGTVTAPDIYLKENTEVIGDCLHGKIHYLDPEL